MWIVWCWIAVVAFCAFAAWRTMRQSNNAVKREVQVVNYVESAKGKVLVMPLTQAYLIAAFLRKPDAHPHDCRLVCVDLFSEAEPTIVTSRDLFEVIVTRGVGHDFEAACRHAVQSCEKNPRQAWMLERLVSRSRRYLSQPCTHPHQWLSMTAEHGCVTRCSVCDEVLEQRKLSDREEKRQ